MLGEGGVVEVVGVDPEGVGDVVADGVEPMALFGGEAAATGFLGCEPGGEAGVDAVGEGGEGWVLAGGEADEGDEVGENSCAGAADFAPVQGLVGAPEGVRSPGAGGAWIAAARARMSARRRRSA